jgi:uncharacterized protein YndB with AHSA1/START domain
MPFVIDQTVTINAPADVVWRVLTDLPRYAEWNPFCLECESTLKPGDPIRMKVNLGRKPQQVEEVVEEFVAGRHFAYHMKPYPAGALSSLRSHDVEKLGPAQTRYRSHFELRGWMKPLVIALFGTKLRAGFGAMTESVRERAEVLWQQQQPRKSA